jgi:hypothetical protein
MELLDLPNELLLAIVVLIGGFDILPCRLVSEFISSVNGGTNRFLASTYINNQR